ncbi:hypothetical protein CVT26_011106 [Gymnopilus dilepis]|uniref:Retrotransposon Copia-like N-terminal domain-containing protein n=1 Tax=Gymnopilus dilepis TaxID=231916 RepID=A0A409WRK6_9AGAR|nr:hypothetical protein CVT26_011106 [Gymnopilus dilepis]
MAKQDIYKLSETPAPNYDVWEFRTRITAQSKGFLEIIRGTETEPSTGHNSKTWKAWKAKNDAAAELIVRALDDDQLIHVRGLETEPAKMWERLRTVHEKTGVTGSAMDLWTRFHTATYTDTSVPLRTHISTIRSYAEALDRLHKDKPSDTQIISRIFTSLPSSYSTIIKILKSHDNANDLDFVTEQILAEETTQKSHPNHPGIRPIDGVNALMASPFPKSTLVCENLVCKTANRTGHTIDNCFWPGGGKEGQWPEWWFKLRGIPASSSTPAPAAMTASVVASGIVTKGQNFIL